MNPYNKFQVKKEYDPFDASQEVIEISDDSVYDSDTLESNMEEILKKSNKDLKKSMRKLDKQRKKTFIQSLNHVNKTKEKKIRELKKQIKKTEKELEQCFSCPICYSKYQKNGT